MIRTYSAIVRSFASLFWRRRAEVLGLMSSTSGGVPGAVQPLRMFQLAFLVARPWALSGPQRQATRVHFVSFAMRRTFANSAGAEACSPTYSCIDRTP